MRALRAAIAAVAASAFLSGCNPEAPSFRGADVTGASFGRELALVGHDGKPRTLADFRGKAVAIFFGFTQCPDVCPTALSTAAEAMRRLGPDAARVQVLFVTIDPERDTAELLSRYVPAFHPSFLGLYGDAEATARAAKEFKVVYRTVPGWNCSTAGITSFAELPEPAQRYVELIEAEVGAPVVMVSTGPKREETVLRRDSPFARLILPE